MKNIYITLLSLIFLTSPAFAEYYWPTFSYPDKQLLLNLHYLNIDGCPIGEARLLKNSTVNLNQCDSQGSCPAEWIWTAISDEKCRNVSEISFIKYRINNYYNDEGEWDHSNVTAAYGSKNSGETYFEYTMTTPLGEWWICSQQDLNLVECANDFNLKKRKLIGNNRKNASIQSE